MTEYCYQTPKKTNNINKLTILCSFIISNPLYFSYLIFFSPYIFKLLSFLSPLFFTTSLIFLSLVTTLFPLHSKDTFFLNAYNTLLHFQDGVSLPTIVLEELEVYKIFFEISTIDENPIHNEPFQECPVDENVGETSDGSNGNGECESLTMEEQEKVCTKPKEVKVKEEQEQEVVIIKQELSVKRWESNVIEVFNNNDPVCPDEVYETPKSAEIFGEAFVGGQPYMGSFGSSMRKEKEWKRTLACKLFEERHNVNINKNSNNNNNMSLNEEGMDLLWETYETESRKGKSKERGSKKRREKDARIGELMKIKHDDHEDDYDDDDNVSDNAKFCCLQALKLSAGKMNLSMGMRFSKAFKGIGFLQSHARKGRKGYK